MGVDVDLHNLFSIIPNFDFDAIRGIPAFKEKKWADIVPLIAASHFPFDPITFRRQRVIFMVRDPRDVMVSAYFHETQHKHRYSDNMSAFLRDENLGISALVRYLNGWATALNKCENVVVSYEKLSTDTVAETERALTFLRCEINKSAIQSAVNAARFEAMRELEISNGIPGHEYDRSNEASLRIWRGKVREYSKYLSLAEVHFIDHYCETYLTPDAKVLLKQTQTPRV